MDLTTQILSLENTLFFGSRKVLIASNSHNLSFTLETSYLQIPLSLIDPFVWHIIKHALAWYQKLRLRTQNQIRI